jgi:hypothetical protein
MTRNKSGNNIKMDLREIVWDDMDWIDLAEDTIHELALADMLMNLPIP